MSFQISHEMDSNKVFFVQQSELEERLDPLFYVAVQNIKNNITKKAKFRCDDLIKSCSINRGRFGHRPRNDPRFYDGEHPFIQTGDVVAASDNNSPIQYTQTLNERGLKTSKLFQPPKLLFTIAANIGDTAILDYPSCFPDSVVAVIPKNDDVSIEYLNIYLRLIKPYVVELAPYSAQRNLNNQQLAQVPVVIPLKEIQAELVTKMDTAYTAKKQKEEEAQRLLDSIDDYLLGELGIELTEQEENTVDNRIFFRPIRDVSGYRLDPNTYKKERLDTIHSIENGSYNVKPLFQVLKHKVDKTAVLEKGTTYIGLENIESNTGEFITTEEKESISSASVFGRGDILFPKLRPYLNKIFYSDIEGLCSTEFHVLHSVSENNEYVANFLRSKVVVAQTKNLMSGNTLPRLQYEDIQKLLIPIPPIDKQERMVAHITAVRDQAKELQQQAKDDLEQAKIEVEAMILGEDETMA